MRVDEILPLPEPHAITRARERYGIDLTRDDLSAIGARCRQGEGLVETEESGRTHHLIVLGTTVVHVVAAPLKHHYHRRVDIITVMPADYANKRARRDHQHKIRRKRGCRWGYVHG